MVVFVFFSISSFSFNFRQFVKLFLLYYTFRVFRHCALSYFSFFCSLPLFRVFFFFFWQARGAAVR